MNTNFNRASAFRNLRKDTIELYFARVVPNSTAVEYVTDVIIESADPGAELSYEPGIPLEREAAQQLMDDLWLAGVRSIHAKAGDDLVEALKAHVVNACAIRDGLMEHMFLQRETQ